jgi:hypothetical protein
MTQLMSIFANSGTEFYFNNRPLCPVLKNISMFKRFCIVPKQGLSVINFFTNLRKWASFADSGTEFYFT